MNIMVTGDVHMDFAALNGLINKKRPDMVLCCGDFGYWPNATNEALYGRNNPKYPKDPPRPKAPEGCEIHWADGNHEHFHDLAKRESDEVWPRCFYQPRGSHILLPDGRRVLFMGGAASHDKPLRTPGHDWFPEEVITEADVNRVDFSLKYDIVISHTSPRSFHIRELLGFDRFSNYRDVDASELALDVILHECKPELWFFGHWHRFKQGQHGMTTWYLLDHTASGYPWWIWLPDKK